MSIGVFIFVSDYVMSCWFFNKTGDFSLGLQVVILMYFV